MEPRQAAATFKAPDAWEHKFSPSCGGALSSDAQVASSGSMYKQKKEIRGLVLRRRPVRRCPGSFNRQHVPADRVESGGWSCRGALSSDAQMTSPARVYQQRL